MTDFTEFKRMNYFKGFFTTADDWKVEQGYHREKLRLHNRGLHTPGVIRGVASGLRVRAAGGLNLEVLPGSAVDGDGNELYLAQPRLLAVTAPVAASRVVYVAIRYFEAEEERVVNTAMPEYSGFKRIKEAPELFLSESRPDNLLEIELARVDLQPGVTVISDPADPAAPAVNQVDLRYVQYAGAVAGAASGKLTPDLQERLVQLMGRTRKDFAALSLRFQSPSANDVRQAAITIEMLARAGLLGDGELAGLVASLADAERDTGQEVGSVYTGLAGTREWQDYSDSVVRLQDAVESGLAADILTRQDEVAEAARELSEVVLILPLAVAGGGETVAVTGEEGIVSLDASTSHGFGGRTIALYQWDLKESIAAPVANAGTGATISTNNDETPILLDASGAKASAGAVITKYIWDKK
ncbi:hypothetical protein OR1_02458 [Geobacter sp. OR-1]|uniref:hypothetical protein n=1 Tax=Geobacter sp. OR-1 TaxID=1266765 RepID=UPI0005432E6B|nr:hypothetical protein [Geobacter sp. OR-1]GAM10170.1 hypothetical protein OR1_02458 [Geobacter sp. OR-1]